MNNRLLIIEDDLDLCEVLAESFEDEGYDVNHKQNGLEGKRELIENHYDFLILDIKIPGMNGFEILEWLKSSDIRIKIIVLTGMPLNEKISKYINDEASMKGKLLEYADAVINKPFRTEVLISTLNTLAGGCAGEK
ncbi:MAG: response regulator [Spirochaetales bacterium]|nr:response regulator [Spirochaetales bacterium]